MDIIVIHKEIHQLYTSERIGKRAESDFNSWTGTCTEGRWQLFQPCLRDEAEQPHGAPASHKPQLYSFPTFVHHLSLHLHRDHRLFPQSLVQDDSKQIEDRSVLTAIRSTPHSPTSHSLFDLRTSTGLGCNGLTLVYLSHSVLQHRLVVTDTFFIFSDTFHTPSAAPTRSFRSSTSPAWHLVRPPVFRLPPRSALVFAWTCCP